MKVLDRTIPLVQMKMVEVDGNFEGLRIMCKIVLETQHKFLFQIHLF